MYGLCSQGFDERKSLLTRCPKGLLVTLLLHHGEQLAPNGVCVCVCVCVSVCESVTRCQIPGNRKLTGGKITAAGGPVFCQNIIQWTLLTLCSPTGLPPPSSSPKHTNTHTHTRMHTHTHTRFSFEHSVSPGSMAGCCFPPQE